MDSFEMAKALTGKKTTEGTAERQKRTVQISGMATSDSANGTVMVDMGGAATTADDSQSIELQTTVQVKEGDIVSILLTGTDGSAKAPLVIGVVGRGDEQKKEIDSAHETADEAADKANTAESTAQNAENKADSAQGKLDSLSDSYISLFDKLYNTDNGDITNILSTLSGYGAYIGIDPSIPALIIGRSEAGTRMVLTDEQLQFLVNSNVPAVYLSNQRLYAPESEVTTLFFGVTDSSGNTIGTCGWIQRSNGHLSLKKIR